MRIKIRYNKFFYELIWLNNSRKNKNSFNNTLFFIFFFSEK